MKNLILSSELVDLGHKAVVLVVGSDEAMIASLRSILGNYGVRELIIAIDEFEALDKLESITPDLIFLDVSFASMNWLEFCTNLCKGNSATSYIPVIAITDMDMDDERVKMLKINVSGVIAKPIREEDLIDCVDLYVQKSYLIRRLENNEEPTDLDLQIARNLQYTILPDEDLLNACKENYNVEVHHIYQASQALGGDYWTVRQLPDGKLMVCVADFAGHGVSVAIDTFRLHNYLKEFVDYSSSPACILENMNDNFYRILPTGQYLTCFLGIIDTAHNSIIYSGAAVPPALLIGGGSISELDCSGTPIGAYPKASYEDRTVNFYQDSSLMVYSDALVEINGEDKVLFSRDDMLNKIKEWSVGGAKAIYDGVVEKIEETSHHFDDDLTLIVLNLHSV